MTGPRLRVTVVLTLAAVALVGLVAAGSGTLAAPPVGSWAAAAAWYERVGVETATVVVVRLAAIVGAAWLLVGAALQLVASMSLRHGPQRLADAVSPAMLRRLAHGMASLSVTAGLVAPASLLDDPPGIAVMEVLDDDGASTSTSTPASTSTAPTSAAPTSAAPTSTASASSSTSVPSTTTTVLPPALPAEPVPAEPLPATPRPADDEVVVQAGDSFWSLAVGVIAEARGGEPTDREVVDYWQQLIEANRTRLVDPANPDLLYPGQALEVPAPTA